MESPRRRPDGRPPAPPTAPVIDDPRVHAILQRHTEPHIPATRRVYVNRDLRMDRIEVVGFDMDYTLAVYHLGHIEELAYRMTIEGMVTRKGYPAHLRDLAYDPDFVIRGLVVDKHLGNILKMDSFGHVGRVFHGFRELTKAERHERYRKQKVRFSGSRYVWLDTLFALPEAVLYAQIIDDAETRGEGLDFGRLYDDIRESIDLVHRDGSLKAVMLEDLGHYIRQDSELGPTLHKLRSAGKRLFLLTNSFWEYTDAVMTFLLADAMPEYRSWRRYFDLIVVGAGKPGFFGEERPFVEVDAATGEALSREVKSLERGKVYQGGNFRDLEAWTGWQGDGVLYVGDHIYGDILRTKRSGLWRTAMIIQELEDELGHAERHAEDWKRLDLLEDLRARIDDEIAEHKLLVADQERALEAVEQGDPHRGTLEQDLALARRDLDGLRRALKQVLERAGDLVAALDQDANPYWGRLFKEDNENSRFGDQVEDYACIYTSRVTNFLSYSPTRYFRSPTSPMPHEIAWR